MLKKSLLILSAALSLSGSCALTGALHISAPAYVYATDEDDEDYDYLEIYDNTEEDTSEEAAETTETPTETPAPSTEEATVKPHVLDSTPKTADFDFSPQFALSLGVFFLGLSIFFLAQRNKD